MGRLTAIVLREAEAFSNGIVGVPYVGSPGPATHG